MENTVTAHFMAIKPWNAKGGVKLEMLVCQAMAEAVIERLGGYPDPEKPVECVIEMKVE